MSDIVCFATLPGGEIIRFEEIRFEDTRISVFGLGIDLACRRTHGVLGQRGKTKLMARCHVLLANRKDGCEVRRGRGAEEVVLYVYVEQSYMYEFKVGKDVDDGVRRPSHTASGTSFLAMRQA
jgi:hypothetical protein